MEKVLNDVDLSLRAKGLYAVILMKKDNNLSTEELYKMSKEGRGATTTAKKELVNNGYIIVEPIRKDGRFLGSKLILTKEESK